MSHSNSIYPTSEMRLDKTAEHDVQQNQCAKTFCLVRIHPPGIENSVIPLRDAETSLGRDPDCTISLADDFLSRTHAVIEVGPDRVVVRDDQSLNGTFVNDFRISTCPLVEGDQVRIGGHIFKFLSVDHIEVRYHEAVYEMMTLDVLTGTHNRRYFDDALRRELLRTTRHWRPMGLVLIDVDRFKAVNDTYGHLVGDEVLKVLCARIRKRIRGDEVFARIGGDEFAVTLAEIQIADAASVAEEIRSRVSESPILTSAGPIDVTVSIGVGHTNGQEPISPMELIERADRMLLTAKKGGRNQIQVDGLAWSDQ